MATRPPRTTPCGRCGGSGRMPFTVEGGICFACRGRGALRADAAKRRAAKSAVPAPAPAQGTLPGFAARRAAAQHLCRARGVNQVKLAEILAFLEAQA